MFEKLFAEAGLSLDRLRALVQVGASGSIVRAAPGDPARQSQFSRQLKELEDFFQTALVERHGKGIRLTANGRELARISRFFLLGLSNFQRGCLTEGQTYRLGARVTFNQHFLLPLLAEWSAETKGHVSFIVEAVAHDDVERRLHELTLDFGIISDAKISRPLKTAELGGCRLELWVPKALCQTAREAARALRNKQLPCAWAAAELEPATLEDFAPTDAAVVCESFSEARILVDTGRLAAWLPEFLPPADRRQHHRLSPAKSAAPRWQFWLVWNPRLLRLNPHAGRRREALVQELRRRLARA
jgi:DNA-binding transcriptional LysR family regulator